MADYIDIYTQADFNLRPRNDHLRIWRNICIYDIRHKLPFETWDMSHCTNMEYLFHHATIPLDGIEYWDTSSCRNMNSMFYYCNAKIPEGIGNWDTSKCRDMSSMFYRCGSQIPEDICNWDTSACRKMGAMFSHCNNVPYNIGHWDISSCINMCEMFFHCENRINISQWNLNNVIYKQWMFGWSKYVPHIVKCKSQNGSLSGYLFSNCHNYNQSVLLNDKSHIMNDCHSLKL